MRKHETKGIANILKIFGVIFIVVYLEHILKAITFKFPKESFNLVYLDIINYIKILSLIFSLFLSSYAIILNYKKKYLADENTEKKKLENYVLKLLSSCILASIYGIYMYLTCSLSFKIENSFFRCFVVLNILVAFLKNISFYNAHVEVLSSNMVSKVDDNVIHFPDILLFMFLPTVNYQFTYKYKSKYDYCEILKKIFLSIIYFILFILLKENTLHEFYNSVRDLSYENLEIFIVFRYITTCLLLFILFFLLVFCAVLPLLAELFLLEEIYYYYNWWDSNNSDEFWRYWNVEFVKWMHKNIYHCFLSKGYKKYKARFLCFLISGIMHELAMFIACKKLSLWFLIGMAGQVPLGVFTKTLNSIFPGSGNNVFIICMCIIGQPLTIFLYYDFLEN